MNFVATVKLNSPTDKKWKASKRNRQEINSNIFELINNHFICKKVVNLLALSNLSDIRVDSFAKDIFSDRHYSNTA